MAHQIVATSVPRGLDGVSGYQTVLKSAGIPPRVFDRLKARSGYSHRYPHGDSRNPVVYVHRIEELAGSRWHVLGCIRDAGSDHTGRSNFLAHMLAIDSAAARGKPGGPAAAAMARGCFLDKWDGPPTSAAPAKTLVVADRPVQPGDVPAWIGAGLDPGLAGDLAAAAMANRKVVLLTRPGDDVLSLFADALRMVEPSKRWGVTFNTCAIEDFDGTWKAVRADLAEAKDLRDVKAAFIDLTTATRGSADQYARFARGEVDVLPWQKRVAEPEPGRETEQTATATAPKTVDSQPGAKDQKKPPKRNSVTAGKESSSERRPRYEEDKSSRLPWHAITIAGFSFLLIAALIAFSFRDQLFDLVRTPKPLPLERVPELSRSPVKPPPLNVKDTPEYRAATQLKEARNRLANGINGKTCDELRKEAETLLALIENLRRGGDGKPQLRIMADATANNAASDPSQGVNEVIRVCDRVAKILETTSELKIEDFTTAESELKVASGRLSDLRTQVDQLATAETKKLSQQKLAAEEDAQRRRRDQAFKAFQSLSKAVSLPTAAETSSTDIDIDPPPTVDSNATTIDLGALALAELPDLAFRLAVPRDAGERGKFRMEIVRVRREGCSCWEIRYVPSAVALEDGEKATKPRTLSSLVARDGRLWLEVPDSPELRHWPFAMLRRSVILVEAKDPAAPDSPPVVQEIRLVQPTQLRPLNIDLCAQGQVKIDLKPPPGIAQRINSSEGHSQLALPINSLRFEAEFPKGKQIDFELAGDGDQAADAGISDWKQEIAQLNPDLAIEAVIRLSLPAAVMTVNTKFIGAHASSLTMQEVKEHYIKNPEKGFELLRRQFKSQVNKARSFTLGKALTVQGFEEIKRWFSTRSGMFGPQGTLIPMSDHETIEKSFEKYLEEQFSEAKKGMKPDSLPDLPKTYEEFWERCSKTKDEQQWKVEFTDRVDGWAKWFWPQCEKQWQEAAKLFQGAFGETHAIRIKAITSLAYDEADKVYEVPLVVGQSIDDHAPLGRSVGPGPDGGDSAGQPAGVAGGKPEGID